MLDPKVLVRVCFVSPELALGCATLPARKTVQRRGKGEGCLQGAIYGGSREMVGESEDREQLGASLGPLVLWASFATQVMIQ